MCSAWPPLSGQCLRSPRRSRHAGISRARSVLIDPVPGHAPGRIPDGHFHAPVDTWDNRPAACRPRDPGVSGHPRHGRCFRRIVRTLGMLGKREPRKWAGVYSRTDEAGMRPSGGVISATVSVMPMTYPMARPGKTIIHQSDSPWQPPIPGQDEADSRCQPFSRSPCALRRST